MPTVPWTPADPTAAAEARADAAPAAPLVLGSRLELRTYRDVPRFLRAALRIRTQVRRAPGALGVSLIAQPARKTFWTLSAWTDEDALDTFVRTPPHLDVMRQFRGRLVDPRFTTWTVAAADLPQAHSSARPLWQDARVRLAATHEGARR
jgi:quinol monooxygenase YgiN